MIHKVLVPPTESILIWAQFLNANNCVSILAKHSIDAVEFSFIECTLLRPHHIVTLACLIEEYHIYGIKILFKEEANYVCDYLKQINFFNYWNGDIDRSSFNSKEDRTAFSLWKIKKEMISYYAEEAKKYFTNNYLLEKELDPISICLGELFNNIYDHAKSQVDGYVLTQFYPKRRELVIAVSDFGVGIPDSINNFLKSQNLEPVSDEEAIRKSFVRGFTTQSQKHNKGFGLNTLKSNVRTLNGRMTLITGNTVYYQQSNGEEIFKSIPDYKFAGTTMAIFFNTTYLEELEHEQNSEEFCL